MTGTAKSGRRRLEGGGAVFIIVGSLGEMEHAHSCLTAYTYTVFGDW